MTEVVLKTNRMSSLIQAAWQAVGTGEVLGNRRIKFTYYCDEDLEITLKPNDRLFRLIAPRVYNAYSDKGRIGQIVAGTSAEPYFPPTCLTVEEAQKRSDVALWFSKNRHGTAGKAMECVRADQLEAYELPPFHVLQGGVEDIALYEGRKFTSRIYLLVWNGGVWMYHNGFNVVHGVPYVKGSTDYAVQILHEGYQRPDSPVKLEPFSKYEKYQTYWPALQEAARALVPALDALKAGSSSSDYLFLGIDCMLLADGGVKFLEINAIPNFVHTQEINTQVNIPFFTSCFRVMLGKADDRLEKLD